MSYVAIWLQACLHRRCAYFQTLSWNDTIFVADWDILYKLCGSANKRSKGFVFSGKIWWQLFSCNKACSKYHTRSTTTPKYTPPQRLVLIQTTFFIVLYFWREILKTLFSIKLHFSCRITSQSLSVAFSHVIFWKSRLALGTKMRSYLVKLIGYVS